VEEYIRIGDYYDGYAKVKFSDGKFGFVHLYGTLLPEKFEEVENFKNGVAFVKLESGRWININTEGEFVRSTYTYEDLQKQKERENSKYRLHQIVENSIEDMNNYIDKMFDYIETVKQKNLRKKGN
jgi:hypothetical protein